MQTLALKLHELATNALKYGALSRPEGRLDVRWDLVGGADGETQLRVNCRESGVEVSIPAKGIDAGSDIVAPLRRGYGREFIRRALPYQLWAETSSELTPLGVRCTVTLPVSSTMDSSASAREDTDT